MKSFTKCCICGGNVTERFARRQATRTKKCSSCSKGVEMKCLRCKEEIEIEEDDFGFETANYKFHLCLECCTEIEEEIYALIYKNRTQSD